MTVLSDFLSLQKTFNQRQTVAIDGLVQDVAALNEAIRVLQESQGQVTPEDQASIDELEAMGEALTAKIEALDSATPPTSPPVSP